MHLNEILIWLSAVLAMLVSNVKIVFPGGVSRECVCALCVLSKLMVDDANAISNGAKYFEMANVWCIVNDDHWWYVD